MYSILSLAIDIFCAAVFAVPLYCAFWRKKTDIAAKFGTIVFIVYMIGVFSLVGIPSIDYIRFEFTVNLIPFADMISSPKSAILNVLLFVPFGILLPVLWKERFNSLLKVVFAGLILSLSIEVLQIFTFRLTDINDLITNTAGSAVGYLIYATCLKNSKITGRLSCSENINLGIAIIAVFLIMFSVSTLISNAIWGFVLG